jgi:hypothetical protein
MDELEALDQSMHIDLGKPRFGLEQRADALLAVSGVAALVGWDDPRVAPLVARVAAHEQRFTAALRSAFESLDAKKPRDPDYAIAGMRCGKDAALPSWSEFRHTACVVDLSITDAKAFFAVSTKLDVMLDDGTMVEGRISRDESTGVTTVRPANVPVEHAGRKPWAIARRTAKSITVVRVSP